MSVVLEEEARRPYAATSNIIAVFERARSRNLPMKIDDDFFRLAEISDIVFGRVREALTFLAVIEQDGTPTDLLRAMASAGEEEYRELLANAIRSAYADDFNRVDPSADTHSQIVAAFQRYQPRSQTKRMVMLFLGLCRHAGVPVMDAPRDRKMVTARATGQGRTRGGTARATVVRNNDRLPSGGHSLSPTTQAVPLFGVTEDDIAGLSEDEFAEVWTALGKVARSRARARVSPAWASQEAAEQNDLDEEVTE
jgi:Family of unknown function (DUF5343)